MANACDEHSLIEDDEHKNDCLKHFIWVMIRIEFILKTEINQHIKRGKD